MNKIRNIFWGFSFLCLVLSFCACGSGYANEENLNERVDSSTESKKESEVNLYDSFEAIYAWDNSKMNASPKQGTFYKDWNGDGKEDILKIETEEIEGSEIIKVFELALSGSNTVYTIENLNYYFIDIIPGNFDNDDDTEILLLFDTRYVGAKGSLGIQLLNFNGAEYTNLLEDFFLGNEYTVNVQSGKNGGYFISKSDGEEVKITKDYVYDSAIGIVTGFYLLEVLENNGINYIKIKQYVAGEDKTDHVGDVISVWEITDSKLALVYEEIESVN